MFEIHERFFEIWISTRPKSADQPRPNLRQDFVILCIDLRFITADPTAVGGPMINVDPIKKLLNIPGI
jgi:hypothetical protein